MLFTTRALEIRHNARRIWADRPVRQRALYKVAVRCALENTMLFTNRVLEIRHNARRIWADRTVRHRAVDEVAVRCAALIRARLCGSTNRDEVCRSITQTPASLSSMFLKYSGRSGDQDGWHCSR